MSFQSFVTERLAVITAQLNAIGTNAKKIDELPVQSTLSPVSKIHVSRGGVSESLEVQKIIDSIKNNTYNQLISIGTITTLNNEVSIPVDARWQINGIRYNTIAVTKIPMPYSAAGTTRTDIIVANILSKIVRIAGAETAGIAVRPNIPVDTVLVTEINISNTVISDFITPVIGDAFANKLDKGGYTGTAQNLKDEITGLTTPDIVLKEGVITVTGLTISIVANDFQWRLNQVNYLVTPAYSKLLVAATVGFKRTDILEGDFTGNYFIKQGIEGEFAAPAPAVTAGRIRLVAIPIFGSTVGTPDMSSPSKNGPTDKPISVYSEFDKGISLYKDKISIWRYMGVVSKYINIYWSNINSIYDIQFPNKPAGTETFAMLSDLQLKVDKVTGERLINATEITKLGNQSGTNSGDETASSIITKIGDGTKINQSYLPSYVDDILEYTNLAGFPAIGESGKIYVAIDSSKQYRWTGSAYLQITNGLIATTNDVPEGTSNLYFNTARVLGTLLSGLSLVTGGAIVSTDSVLVAFGKLQKQINDLVSGKQNTFVAGTNVTIDNTNPLAPIINVNILNANDNVLGTIIPGIRTLTELTITAPNTTYSILNNILNVSKSVGVFQADKFVFSNYGTSTLDNFELEIVGVCKTLGLGIAPFLDSLQTSYKFLWSCRRTNTGMAIASTTSDGTTWNDRITSTNIVLIEKNDLVSFKMTRIKNKIIFTVKNISTGESSDLSFVSNYNETANCQPTMFQYGFQVLDGEWEINSFTVKSNEQKNIDYLFVGDSITQGFSMEDSSVIRKSSSSRFFDLFKNRNTQKISLHASGGAQILDMQTTLNEIGLRNPKAVFLMLGTNGTNQANYQTLINAITAKGISVYPLTIPPTNGTFNAWIKSTYSQYIDASQTLFTGGDSSASTWNATYQGYAGHPNSAGHGVVYDKLKSVLSALKLVKPTLISSGTTSTEINLTWTQSLNNNGYILQYSTDGTNFINLATVAFDVNVYKHNGLTLNQTFYYRILAIGITPFISSDYSTIVNFSATNDVVLGDFSSVNANVSRIISMNRKLASGIDGWFKCSVSTLTLAQLDRVIFALRHDNLLTGADNWVYHNYMFYYFQDNMIHLSSTNADVAPPTIVRQANQWIRLRRTSGTVYYEYSNDNISWVILASRIDSGDLYAQLMFLMPDTQIKSVTVSGTFVAV